MIATDLTPQEIDIDTDGRPTGNPAVFLPRGTSSEAARDHLARHVRQLGRPGTSPFRNCTIIGEFRPGALDFSRNVISSVSSDARLTQFSVVLPPCLPISPPGYCLALQIRETGGETGPLAENNNTENNNVIMLSCDMNWSERTRQVV